MKENNSSSHVRFVGKFERVIFAGEALFCACVVDTLGVLEQRPQIVVITRRQRLRHREVVLTTTANTSKTVGE